MKTNQEDQRNSKYENYNEKYQENLKKKNDQEANVSINFAEYDDQENELYYEKFSINSKKKYETFANFVKIETSCFQCKKVFSSKNKLHKYLKTKCKSKSVNKSSKNVSHIKNFDNHVENSIIIKSIAFKIDKEYDLAFKK